MEHALRLTLGPMELWAYSTTPEDVEFRRLVAGKVGVAKALTLLAANYPTGSVASFVQEFEEAEGGRDEVYERMVRKLVGEGG